MATPDITPAQYGAVGALVVALGAAYGAGVHGWDFRVLAVCATLLSIALVVADALIRRGRANIAASEALVADASPDPTDMPQPVDVPRGVI